MFVRRESAIPFANRLPTLRFNNNEAKREEQSPPDPGVPGPPLKSNLKASNFLHPILVAQLYRARNRPLGAHAPYPNYHHGTVVTPRNSTICIIINVKLIGSINAVEEIARTSIDILTFPAPFTEAKTVDVFSRLKALLALIVYCVAKLRQTKTPEGKSQLTENEEVKVILMTLKKTKIGAKKLRVKCKSLAKHTHGEYTYWANLVNGTIETHLHAIQKEGYRLYSDLTLPLAEEDYKSYESVTRFKGPQLNMNWTPTSLRFEEPNITFDQLTLECQLEFIQELAKFGEELMKEANVVMDGCLQRWEKEYSNLQIRAGYESIRDEVEEVKLDQRADACLFYELKNTMDMLNIRKLDVVKAYNALVAEIKGLLKLIKTVMKFLKQTYKGRSENDKPKNCACCNRLIDGDTLTKALLPGEKCGIATTLTLSPKLIDMIDACKRKEIEEDAMKGFVEVSLLSDGEEQVGDTDNK